MWFINYMVLINERAGYISKNMWLSDLISDGFFEPPLIKLTIIHFRKIGECTGMETY